jgi:hypothetical protein
MPAMAVGRLPTYRRPRSHGSAESGGTSDPVQGNRGKILDVDNGLHIFMTIHPSALLRLQDKEEKRSGYASFVNDLRSIERLVGLPQAKRT